MKVNVEGYKKEDLATIVFNGSRHMAKRVDGKDFFESRRQIQTNEKYLRLRKRTRIELMEMAENYIEFFESNGNIEALLNASIMGRDNQKINF